MSKKPTTKAIKPVKAYAIVNPNGGILLTSDTRNSAWWQADCGHWNCGVPARECLRKRGYRCIRVLITHSK